jgi:hypothetical protein
MDNADHKASDMSKTFWGFRSESGFPPARPLAGSMANGSNRRQPEAGAAAYRRFFADCDRREAEGAEPDWKEHKRLLTGGVKHRWI